MTPADRTGAASGGHGFARSIDDWRYALTPAYTTQFELEGGGNVSLKRRERPQLLLKDGIPQVSHEPRHSAHSSHSPQPCAPLLLRPRGDAGLQNDSVVATTATTGAVQWGDAESRPALHLRAVFRWPSCVTDFNSV